MRPAPRQAVKLRRVVGYGATALIAAWSLLALAAYAGVEAIVGWLSGIGAADGAVAGFVLAAAPLDGVVVAMVWLVGVVILGGAAILVRRLVLIGSWS